jgi:DNA-binding GntR family transcriptional regulator
MSQLPQLSASTLADQAYAAMREAIVAGTLSRGERVTERGLAESLNISPTPVREALRRLEQDQLVERTGPRSVRIAQYGEDHLREITLIEDSLRTLTARLAADKATDAQLAQMRDALDHAEALCDQIATTGRRVSADTATVAQILGAMRHFHAVVDEACGNPTLIHMLKMVDAFDSDERRRSVLVELQVDPKTIEGRYQEHRAIFDAIARRDPEAAEHLMRAHSASANTARLSIRPLVS